MRQTLLDKHYLRKHGKDAYYGQGKRHGRKQEWLKPGGKARVGIVGCGNISEIYLKNLTTMFENVEVAAVADLVPETGARPRRPRTAFRRRARWKSSLPTRPSRSCST